MKPIIRRSLRRGAASSAVLAISTLTAIWACAPTASQQAHAGLLLFEPFDYPTGGSGSLGGQSGGIGWTSAWQNLGNAQFGVTNTNLSYPPGSFISSSGNAVSRTGPEGQSSAARRTYNASTLFGGELWFSFLVEPSSVATGSDLRLQPLTHSANAAGDFNNGLGIFLTAATGNAGTNNIQARIGTTQGNNVSIATDTTHFVVGRMSLPAAINGAATVDIWLDPDVTNLPNLAPDSTITVANLGSATGAAALSDFDTYYFRYGLGWHGTIDEFRVADNFSAVAIPEPTRIMLLGLAALGLLLRRRRTT